MTHLHTLTNEELKAEAKAFAERQKLGMPARELVLELLERWRRPEREPRERQHRVMP